jgi:hypothetical protein
MKQSWNRERGYKGREHVLVDELLEVVTAAGSMDGIDATGVVDILDVGAQLGRRIGRETSKRRDLPEPGQQIQLAACFRASRAGVGGMARLEAPC